MRRFFIPPENIQGKIAVITGGDVLHLSKVLRKQSGDIIEAADGRGNILKARIVQIESNLINLDILETHVLEERKVHVRLFQAIPRGSKFDWIIEKASELGVMELIPVVSERTVPKIVDERGLKKLSRWQRIALESMKQVGRTTAMTVHRAIPIAEVGSMIKEKSLKILPWELEEDVTLKTLVQANVHTREIEILIGPEGGLSIPEAEDLKKLSFQTVSLGKRILKAETAAVVTLGNVFYELEE